MTCAGPFAGKPAPTGSSRSHRLCSTCGSGFTREEAGTGKTDRGTVPLFFWRQAPVVITPSQNRNNFRRLPLPCAGSSRLCA
ncbi:hypothetical protein B8W72_06180 [Pseudomonas putida]|uniref:Uncharacterized protein n=1 Tax=Pseudomonas putida TaxID=303 RepID=A0A1Y3LH24_PSEPU|nr:hypothetical protein B8W72_06180 [Pseudomonas putida]